MNVVVAADFAFVNGGAGKIALESAKGLAKRGHRVVLFTGVGPIADDLRDIRGLSHVCLDQKDVWHNPSRVRAAAQGLWNGSAAQRFDSVLARLDPRDTIVHLHSWTKALSSSVVRRAASRGFRIVTTLHDFLSVCPTGTLFNHGTLQCCTLKPLSLACVTSHCDSRSYAQKVWRVARQVVQKTAGTLPGHNRDFITVSASSARIFRNLLPTGSRLHQVDNFSEVPRMDPVAVEHNDTLVYVGRLSAEKGPLLFADCLARLRRNGVFVGEGDLAGAIQALAPDATLTGWLNAEQVLGTLRQARALVFPSLWYETQGLVVAEAAALGVPAIVPDTSAARDWVVPGTTGLWFKGGSVADLSSAIERLMSSPFEAARMGRAAYERFWVSPPTLERHLRQLESVYAEMLRRDVTDISPAARHEALEDAC